MWKTLSFTILLVSVALTSPMISMDGNVTFSSSSRSCTSPECGLADDYYDNSCPRAEVIIRSTVLKLYQAKPEIAPALLRLVFHDCFIEGCDGSVLLNSTSGVKSEKEARPNLSLKGFDVIDAIKDELEAQCPGTVSCSDILVLAARDAVFLVGGPYYTLKTGRRDSLESFYDLSGAQLPKPDDGLPAFPKLFQDRHFSEREVVTLLGGHNIGTIHCQFIMQRLTNFSGSGRPDPSIAPSLLEEMIATCTKGGNGEEPGMKMGAKFEFGSFYYKSLLQRKGILTSDQILTANERTNRWVKAYGSSWRRFQGDFALAMTKLSSLNVKTGAAGEVRLKCSSIN